MTNSILSPLSFTSVFDTDTGAVIQADIYFYTGGTTVLIPVYEDAAMTTPHDQPIRTTGNGRFPPIFVGEISAYRIRVYDLDGVLLEDVNDLPGAEPDPATVADPIATDQTALLATGDIIARFASEASLARTNFVRCNGKHIGPTSIGAGAVAGSELASDDCEDLFLWLWGVDTANRLTVYTTNGVVAAKTDWATAAAAWAAKARIQVPDLRGRTIAGLDAMGNSASARLTGGLDWATGTGVAPGDVGGSVSHTLTLAQMANHDHGYSQSAHSHSDTGHAHTFTTNASPTGVTANQSSHTHTTGLSEVTSSYGASGPSGGLPYAGDIVTTQGSTLNTGSADPDITISDPWHTHTGTTTTNAAGITAQLANITFAAAGGGAAHNNMQPTLTLMFYMRL